MRCECVQCGYDLTPLATSWEEALRCPECGNHAAPAPVNFMGVLRSRRRTILFMVLPMILALPATLGLRLLGTHLYGFPILAATPLVLVISAIVSQTREKSARGKRIWDESLLILMAAWFAAALIGSMGLMFASIL